MKKVGQAHLFSKLIMIPAQAKKKQGTALPGDCREDAETPAGSGRGARRGAAWRLAFVGASPCRAASCAGCRLPYSIVQVSPAFSSFIKSPAPIFSMAVCT